MLCECGAGSDCTSWGAGSAGRKMGEAVLGHGTCNSFGQVQKLCSGVSGEVLKQVSERAVRVSVPQTQTCPVSPVTLP